ncbi:serine/threonine-protein kinase [Pleurocapsa sp. PCC 7319]|uniref:serine/threonine-protein kinase n=1 Tax=Pleurocapsa sp. PCC 7319 TaxID=118161 RepID=UPI0003472182|nr:serine/threonine-protein kinase [Pleurocapsa sp. PCC 7319]
MNGKLFSSNYRILKTLGQDKFSETFLAQDHRLLSHRRYVIKKFRPILGNLQGQATKLGFYQEASVLKRLSGDSCQIPRLYEYFMDGEDFYLVREWIPGITLEQKIRQQGRLAETEVKNVLSSILSVLKYIHSYGIVYRDLKPSSIVLRQVDWLGKLRGRNLVPVPIYFSGVKELAKEKISVIQNSFYVLAKQKEYIPPEQERGKSVYASDLYSLGLTAIFMLTAKTPSELEFDYSINRMMWQGEASELKTNLVRIIDRAICPSPQARFASAEEMLQALHSQLVLIPRSVENQPTKKFWSNSAIFNSEIKVTLILFLLALGIIGIFFSFLNFDFTQLIENYNWELESQEVDRKN